MLFLSSCLYLNILSQNYIKYVNERKSIFWMCVLYIIYLCICVETEVIVLKLFTKLYLKQTERNLKLIMNENEVKKVFSGNTRNQ